MPFTHAFDPTTLREYDIRGIVGRTLHSADAFAVQIPGPSEETKYNFPSTSVRSLRFT